MYTTTLHTYAGSYWVDAVVVTLHSHLGTLTRHTGNAADGNQAVVDFRNLGLEHTLQELSAGTRQDDAGIVVLVLYLLHDGTDGLALTVVVRWNLLGLWQVKLVALVVDEQYLTLPHLVNLSADNLSHLVLVLLVQRVVLQFQNLRGQGLAQVQDGTATELLEVYFLRNLLAYLVVGFYLLCLCQADFLVLVLYLTVSHHNTVAVNLEVTLVGVYNHVVVLVRTEHLGNDVAEAFFQHAHQCGTINVLCFFKFLKGLNH